MPVDPGNLMLVGDIGGRPVLGAPGCARCPRKTGSTGSWRGCWQESRSRAQDITGFGVGGLLMEIVTRPQPRDESRRRTGAGSRPSCSQRGAPPAWAGPTSCIADIKGRPLVRIAAEEALASRADGVIVVTGHQRERVEQALAGLEVRFVHNPDFAEGLSTSLKAGLAAVPAEADGAIICLGDMPQVRADMIDRLIGAFDPARGALIVVPVIAGKRGNPVLWSRRFFPELAALEGDVGARHLIGGYGEAVVEVPADAAALVDIDTPEALSALRAEIERDASAPVEQFTK